MLVCWLVDAWNAIPSEMIEHSFKKCGISCNLDGMEDDSIFDDVCPAHATPVGSNASATESSSDDSEFEGFHYTDTGMLYAHITMVLKPLSRCGPRPTCFIDCRFIASIETQSMLCNKYNELYSHCTSAS